MERIWAANRLQPHRIRTFKQSKDPAFAAKVKEIVGLYMAPPCHAVVLSIVDNYATHKHAKVLEWLADHPRWIFHFTPTSTSWINTVEDFFLIITQRSIRRGVFKFVADLQETIARDIRAHNRQAKPFVWTKLADIILSKLNRLLAPSE